MDDSVKSWPAPAKINLFLHVVGRRPDGYHLLQTAFQFLELSDTLHFEPRSDGAVRRIGGLAEVPEDADLVVRAARRLQEQTGSTRGADIHVDKRIPAGGGLGGGSSDAATTLVALDAIWGLGLGTERLAEIGLALGADVPVFVRGRAAWAEGVGEILTPIDPPESWLLVVKPDCTVPTAEIFKAAELTRNTPPMTMLDLFAGRGRNDCEPVVRIRYPQVARALDWLGRHASARMSGTGACIFARFQAREGAEAVARELPSPWTGFITRTINVSPLLARRAGD
ncbi:MAG: 4-(cytidine 5'-diphospho)-2-C-methyl-D-erythritol kinase [Gammaproteobacteria bacterium]